MVCGNVVPVSELNVTVVNTVVEPVTDTVPICLIELSPKIHKKLLRLRNATIECTRSASTLVAVPAASAGLTSSAPLVPVNCRVRPAPNQTRPANTAKVVGFSPGNCGHTIAVAVAPVPPATGEMVTVNVSEAK